MPLPLFLFPSAAPGSPSVSVTQEGRAGTLPKERFLAPQLSALGAWLCSCLPPRPTCALLPSAHCSGSPSNSPRGPALSAAGLASPDPRVRVSGEED